MYLLELAKKKLHPHNMGIIRSTPIAPAFDVYFLFAQVNIIKQTRCTSSISKYHGTGKTCCNIPSVGSSVRT